MPRATEYIEQMQGLITRIYKKGLAYTSNGSVYFNVSEWRKVDTYGKLFKIDFDNFKAGVRIDADEYEREQVSDFVLWKANKPGEPSWDFVLDGGSYPGRPGWHIECSAMEYELLGLPFDIHTGGIDLKFPHHEDEIAQSKAGYGIEPTAFWCHNEFLEVEGEKMSKSKGNYFALRDLLDKNIDPMDIRFSMLSSHYSSIFNFTFDGLASGRKGRFRIQDYIYELFDENIAAGTEDVNIEKLEIDVYSGLANDLHTPKSLAALFSFINNNPVDKFTVEARQKLIGLLTNYNNIFGVLEIGPRPIDSIAIPDEVIKMAEDRIAARKAKNFAESDALRQKIQEAGYIVKDTKDGYSIGKI
jgi:cysteinyl-tRNA synthetase